MLRISLSSLYLPKPVVTMVLDCLDNFAFARLPFISNHMVYGLVKLASFAQQKHFVSLCVISWLDNSFLIVLNNIPLSGCTTVYLFTYWRTFGQLTSFGGSE